MAFLEAIASLVATFSLTHSVTHSVRFYQTYLPASPKITIDSNSLNTKLKISKDINKRFQPQLKFSMMKNGPSPPYKLPIK